MKTEVPANRYVYWVAYHFTTGNGSGVGGRRIFSQTPANSFEWVNDASEFIIKNGPYSQVILTNWLRLENDEHWEN